jgi:hypothetical protein
VAVHPRRTIREKFVSLLDAGIPALTGSVYDSREKQPAGTAPFINVWTPSDESPADDSLGLSLPIYQRILTVEVLCVVAGRPASGTLAGEGDDLARDVELYLADYVDLDGLALTCLLSSSTVEEGLEVDPPAYQVSLVYIVLYEDRLGN